MNKRFLVLFVAGSVFIIIGTASAIYNTFPINVSLDGTVKPGQTDILTPDMNTNNSVNMTVEGSAFDISVSDPSDVLILAKKNISNINYNFSAMEQGEYNILVTNVGDSELQIGGHAQTKGSSTAFTAQLMLIVTGIIIVGLSLRLKNR